MSEQKTQQYTFGPDEKEILEILATFEKEFEEIPEEDRNEIQSVKYYQDYQIKGMKDVEISGVFMTKELDADGNISYHLYYQSPENEILSIDAEGKIQIDPKWRDVIGDIDLEGTIGVNEREPGRLKGISEKAEPEEMEKALKGDKKEEKKAQEEETQEIEEDLQEQGEDLRITKYRKIKDNHVDERMPEVFEDGTENGIAFSSSLNRFVIISKIDGHYQMNQSVEPAKMTWKSIISIDENGERVERKVPYALMKLPNNSKKEIAVTVDEYGYPDIETVDVLPCQERIARSVRTQGEGIEKEESLEMRNEFKEEGIQYPHEIAHQVKEIEQEQRDLNQTVDYDITEDDYIPNTQTTWGELMEGTGESLPKLIERYNREMAKEGAEPQKVVEEIESDYGNVSHEHQRR